MLKNILRKWNNLRKQFSLKRCFRAQKVRLHKCVKYTWGMKTEEKNLRFHTFFELIPLYTNLFSLVNSKSYIKIVNIMMQQI